MIIKCKMCGGDLMLEEGSSVGTCEYCGSTMTLPTISDEKLANLFNRANHFRMKSEFDKAMVSYENIIGEDENNAEAFWGLCLCKYGIEYVDDPATGEKKPTCHRTQFTSILEDSDYKFACDKADSVARKLYEKEAGEIDRIQKQILEISSHEEPFDIFICYKESDDRGERTRDSVLGQELYFALQDEGYKVFFARITLEDKIGEAYEPYIFAALNSAKVMVVIGTKPDYMNAVWVKNEWSRFLDLIRQGQKKMLIPAYRDMDPYDMPEEFLNLQAQDMSRIGFMQDLIRGIRKIISTQEPKEQSENVREVKTVAVDSNSHVAPLLRRAFMFLEDGEFSNADTYCEKVLDMDPENSQAYLGKLMVELGARKQEALADCEKPFEDSNNYQKIMRFGDEELVSALKGYIDAIKDRNEQKRLEGLYQEALRMMQTAEDEEAYQLAAEAFQEIAEYRDAEEKRDACFRGIARIKNKREEEHKEQIYAEAQRWMMEETITSYGNAIGVFSTISGWRDVDRQIEACYNGMERIKEKEEEEKKERIYNWAVEIMNRGTISNYEDAIERFSSILSWKDSEKMVDVCQTKIEEIKKEEEARRQTQEKYREAQEKRRKKQRKKMIFFAIICCLAISLLAIWKFAVVPKMNYDAAMKALNDKDYVTAYKKFSELGDYRQSIEKLERLLESKPTLVFSDAKVDDVISYGRGRGGEDIEWRVLDKVDKKVLVFCVDSLGTSEFDEKGRNVWGKSTLRKWLNEDFIEDYFTLQEQEAILSSSVKNNAEKDTKDRVFLLSTEEAEKYFSSDESRKLFTSSNQSDSCLWWLRSPGAHKHYVAYVREGSIVYNSSKDANCSYIYIRPAMWLSLE